MDVSISEPEKRLMTMMTQTTGLVVQELEYLNQVIKDKDIHIDDVTERYMDAEKKMSKQSEMIENLTKEINSLNSIISKLSKDSPQ